MQQGDGWRTNSERTRQPVFYSYLVIFVLALERRSKKWKWFEVYFNDASINRNTVSYFKPTICIYFSFFFLAWWTGDKMIFCFFQHKWRSSWNGQVIFTIIWINIERMAEDSQASMTAVTGRKYFRSDDRQNFGISL